MTGILHLAPLEFDITTLVNPLKNIYLIWLTNYIKYIKLKLKDAISRTLVGELLTVFEALQVVGKYVNSNGISTWLVKAELYGPSTSK